MDDREVGLRLLKPDEVDIGEVVAPTLKPCPFCGGWAMTSCGVNDRTGIYVARVMCTGIRECTASVIGSSRCQPEARRRARDMWDRRAAQPDGGEHGRGR